MPKVSNETRAAALRILEDLARHLQAFNADFFYIALDEAGFTEEERIKLTGACFRTAQKNHWLLRTGLSEKSKRNSSNLQSIWLSRIFALARDGESIPKDDIEAQYKIWRARGFEIPEKEVKMWSLQNDDETL